MFQEIKLLPVIGYGCAFIMRVGNYVNRIIFQFSTSKNGKVF